MFSRLDQVFQTLPRQAENTDTRLGIKRDENREDGSRKQGRQDKDEESHLWEDSTAVSVRALRAFLDGMIKNSTQQKQSGAAGQTKAPPAPPATPAEPPSATFHRDAAHASDAARAAKAYKAMYYTGQKEHLPPIPAAPPATGGANLILAPEEERTIHKLIADLDTLAARGIEELRIMRSESFLQSLVEAAHLAILATGK